MPSILWTQAVSEVERARVPLRETSPKEAIEGLIKSRVESCSEYHGNVVECRYHPLVAAVHRAFADHRPLMLSPDMFWLLIAQGLARHVNNNAEDLRSRFVSHEGTERITVRRDDFVKGSPENPWNEVFNVFSNEIKKRIGEDNHSKIVVTFATTGPIEKAANEVVLMESMRNYFEYVCHTLCGIPEVILEGEAEDWSLLHDKTAAIGKSYGLEWWTNRLLPTLSSIAANAAGADDPEVWQDIYKLDGASGGPYMDGWIIDFFPYLQRASYVDRETGEPVHWQIAINDEERYYQAKIDVKNWMFADHWHGITAESLPGSLSRVPFVWQYLDKTYDMEFLAGFTAFTQDSATLAVRPKIGWAVREAE